MAIWHMYFMAISYIFPEFWYIFTRFGMLCQETSGNPEFEGANLDPVSRRRSKNLRSATHIIEKAFLPSARVHQLLDFECNTTMTLKALAARRSGHRIPAE
jgi:hypothetical protein